MSLSRELVNAVEKKNIEIYKNEAEGRRLEEQRPKSVAV